MKSLKTLLVSKSIIAAAIAASSLAAPAIAQTTAAITANIIGTPNDGVVCRSGYRASFDGTNLKCLKNSSVILKLSCDNPRLSQYVSRSPQALNETAGGADICIPANGNIGPTDSLQGLSQGPNGAYDFAKVNMTTVASEVAKASQTEAAALGVPASSVETVQSITFPQLNTIRGVKDESATQINHFTFAIPTGGLVGNQGPVGLPATANSTSAFVPRPLPR